MRELSTTELAMQDQTKASNQAHFIKVNTSELPDYEKASAGFEMVGGGLLFNNDPHMRVHKIRYSGSFGGRNTWGL